MSPANIAVSIDGDWVERASTQSRIVCSQSEDEMRAEGLVIDNIDWFRIRVVFLGDEGFEFPPGEINL